MALKITAGCIFAFLMAAFVPYGAMAGTAALTGTPPRVTILTVPGPVLPEDLEQIEGAAVGLMSPGLGDVPPEQTWLDVSQGSRVFDSKYDTPLNTLFTAPGLVSGWSAVLRRAASAGVTVRPGLLATELRRRGLLPAAVPGSGTSQPSGLALVTRGGWLKPAAAECPGLECSSPVTVSTANLAKAARLAAERRPDDLLVVIESPPVASGEQLAIAIAGPGFDGMLRSASTRTPGYVLSTDLAPTVLEYFGLQVPGAMTGLPVASGGEVDYRALAELEGRYREVGQRKGTAMLFPLLAWLLVTGVLALVRNRRFAAPATTVLCLSVVLLPAVLLLTAWLSPSLPIESAIAGLLPVAAALALMRYLRGWDALALACAITVAAFAVDLVAGLSLTPKAVIGPNPGLGARFYGIGNELESTLMILTSVGTGAALQARAGRLSRGREASAFLLTGLAGTVVFASGRFGADVGAAIIFPLAAVVAAAVVARRPRLIWLGAVAAVAGVALLAVADTFTGSDTHFVRSILQGGSADSVPDVLAHRLEATWQSFTRLSRLPVTLVAIGLAAIAWHHRKWLQKLLSGLDPLRAGLIAAAAGSIVGALTNDSGALFIHVGVLYLSLAIGFVWAERHMQTGA